MSHDIIEYDGDVRVTCSCGLVFVSDPVADVPWDARARHEAHRGLALAREALAGRPNLKVIK